ncbi:MAG: LysM peptidoglycan-binding domain-containing protein [Elusimicrobiales bacterium]|nr:LysM peptidoglycan-binding domain-containing protein [Elusimicrobiales bacterium]
MRLILSISIFVLSMGGFVYADVLKLIGDDTVKTDTATVVNDNAVKEKKGIEVDKRHHVIKGDTLWDLAGKYYADPFKWGIIYNANIDAIENPDLIYPEEGFLIPGIKEKIMPKIEPIAEIEVIEEEVAEVEEEEIVEIVAQEPAEEPVVEIEKPRKFKIPEFSEEMPADQMEWNSMLVTDLVGKNWSGDGYIVGKEDKQEEDSLSFGGDIVKIKMKFSKSASIGQILNVYKLGSKVHDDNGKFKGFRVQRVGIVEVIEVKNGRVKGVVVQANSSIMKGQIIKK